MNQNNLTNNNTSKPYNPPNIDLLMGPHFDFEKVNDHIDTEKKQKKDPFNFVNDLLKAKK